MDCTLREERTGWLCTLRPDGSPHLTPVWFVAAGEAVWIGSGADNVKVRNIAADPRVSLAFGDGDRPAVAEGHARVHRGDFPPDVLAALAAKYDGWDAAAELPAYGPRVLIEVEVRRWLRKP